MRTNESNFYFLKEVNKNIFKIIKEAEKLYTDEYFQQCMVQTRCFAENVTKSLLNGNCQPGDNFDTLLGNLDDYLINCEEKRDLIKDLYFLKKAGNASAHTRAVDKDGIKALECLQRSFEIAVVYYSMKNGSNKNVCKLLFDEELLVTGKRSKYKNTIKEKYLQSLAQDEEIQRRENISKPKKKRTSKFDRYPTTPKTHPKTFFTKKRKIILILWLIACIFSLLALGTVKFLVNLN